MAKKGMELPINMIVVVLIAVLVLVTVGAFLTQNMSQTSAFGLEQAFGDGCLKLRNSYSCASLNFPVKYQKQGDTNPTTTFSEVCVLKGYEATLTNEPNSCARACGCTIQTTP